MTKNYWNKKLLLFGWIFLLGFRLNAFARTGGDHYIQLNTPGELQQFLNYTGDQFFLLSAHRGGPESNLPENCIATFENIMMQVFLGSPEKVREFEKTGIPWHNIVAFVGHSKPEDPAVTDLIHQHGVICIVGTSRNLDREYSGGAVQSIMELKDKYNALFQHGTDVLETDIPMQVSKILPPGPAHSIKLKYLK